MSHHKGMQKRLLAAVMSLSLAVPAIAGMDSPLASAKTVKVTSLSLQKPVISTLALKKGESYGLKWKVKPSKGTLTFSSSKKSVVTVSKKGELKAKKPGAATVTIASKSKPEKSVKIKVTVYKKFTKVKKVKLWAASKTIELGQTTKLTSSLSPTKATVKKLTYVSKDKKVARVNSKGTVTGKKAGTTTITAYAKDGRGAKASVKITVKAKSSSNGAAAATTTPTSGSTARPEPTPTEVPVLEQNEPGNFIIASDVSSADIYVDKNGKDYDGLSLVANSFQGDVNTVSSKGAKPRVVNQASQIRESAIIAGSIGNNDIIDKLIADGKLDVSDIKGKTETYKIQVVENPAPGVKLGLVIVGTDKRGAIYGIYHISEKMGVSPWVYWGDVSPVQKEKISFSNDSYTYTSKQPSVRYRGIFLNDEAPSLTGWVKKKFGNYNEKFYVNVYELLLRCKGNYLWPAMWSNNFSEDGTKGNKLANAELADKYGIVMGTSHHEPLCRAGIEWQSKYKKYSNSNAWDFNKNAAGITEFWRDGVNRNMAFENVYTIGMRGEADSALAGGIADNINLLKRVITTQKGILKENNLQDAPQVLTVYKEVEDYWHGTSSVEGLKKWSALDDVIVMLCDDNFGNMRTLPEGKDINRKGGWGMYYHFDYHGGPVSYEWVNTVQIDKVWEQMSMAYEHGVDDIWIVNVGDLKPMEMNISYFLDLAYDYDSWGKDGAGKTETYRKQWVQQQFGQELNEEQQKEVQSLLEEYTWLNGSCKPEVVSSNTYDVSNYNEARTILGRIKAMMEKADQCKKIIPERLQAAYFQLVYYPVVASANVAKMQICSGLNKFYYEARNTNANLYGVMIDDCIALDKELQETYNKNMPGVGNKWERMMSSPHVGYTNWNSDGWKYPSAKWVCPADGTKMTVHVQNKPEVVSKGQIAMDDFTNINQESYTVIMSNTGGGKYDYTVKTENDWIVLSKNTGSVKAQDTFEVSVDWSKVKEDKTGSIVIQSGDNKVTVNLQAKVYDTSQLKENTYVYANGYAAMLPGRYTGKKDSADGATVTVMNGYGKMGESLKIQPAVKRYTSDVSQAPYAEYSVNMPAEGDYKITVYSAPSNNLERDDVSINFGLGVNAGEVKKINTIKGNHSPGNYDNAWPEDVKNNGRVSESTVTMKAGVNTIRIYAADPGFVLQKVVVSKESVKKSHLGPEESYYVGKKLQSKSALSGLDFDWFALPGQMNASAYNGSTATTDTVDVKQGDTLEYTAVLPELNTYQFGVYASSDKGAELEILWGENSLGTVTLGKEVKKYRVPSFQVLEAAYKNLSIKVTKGNAKLYNIFSEIKKFYDMPGNIAAINYEDSKQESGDLTAAKGTSYEYCVKAVSEEDYQFGILGSSQDKAKVTMYLGDTKFGEVTLGTQKKTYKMDGATKLRAGKDILRMEVSGGTATISTIKLNVRNLTEEKLVTITASSQEEGKIADYVYDKDEKTTWKAEESDSKPTITFDFGEEFAIDRFAIDAVDEENTSGYVVETAQGDSWSELYRGSLDSGKYVFLQGKTVVKVKKVRFVFDEAVELSRIHLTPYINWAVDGSVTVAGLKKDGSDITVPKSIFDGDRITKGMEDETGSSTDIERHIITLTFPEEKVIDTVRLITLEDQESENPGSGVIPDLSMTSSRGQYSYRASYYNGTEWKTIGATEKPEAGEDPKVFSEFVLNNAVKTSAIRIEIYTSYWIRINELEAVQSMRFTPASMMED